MQNLRSETVLSHQQSVCNWEILLLMATGHWAVRVKGNVLPLVAMGHLAISTKGNILPLVDISATFSGEESFNSQR
jgi:hypothetical protein